MVVESAIQIVSAEVLEKAFKRFKFHRLISLLLTYLQTTHRLRIILIIIGTDFGQL